MRVLWVVNIVIPQIAEVAGVKATPFGGWIGAMAEKLAAIPDIDLGIATRSSCTKRLSASLGGIEYFVLPHRGRNRHDVSSEDCAWVFDRFRPDLLHIKGTEFPHARTFLSSWTGPNIVELQGIVNGHEVHQYGGLQLGGMLRSMNPVKTVAALSMFFDKQLRFRPRVLAERATMRMAQNFIGRTKWDQANSYAFNPQARYFRCERILRGPFYDHRWDIEGIQRHSLFIGNAAKPLKGAHYALRAIAQLVNDFPDLKLVVGGAGLQPSGWSDVKRKIGYSAYFRKLVRDLRLEKHVEFAGLLTAPEMAERMSNSHVVLVPSTIENSPNTLGEAMVIGVPVVSAYCGGAPDMARDEEEVLFYRDNEPSVLAFQIRRIFENDSLALRLSQSGRRRGLQTHDPEKNLEALLAAYRAVGQRGQVIGSSG